MQTTSYAPLSTKLMAAFVIATLAMAVLPVQEVRADTHTSTATGGNWGDTSTWVSGVVPATSDTVIIATTGGNSVQIAATLTQTAGGSVTVNNGATLNATTAGVDVTFGALTINSGGTLTMRRPMTVLGATNITGTINFGSTDGGAQLMSFNGNVTLNSGADWNETLVGASANLQFYGNLTNNATTFTTQYGYFMFPGSGKTISGATPTSVFRMLVAGTVTNNGTVTVANEFGGGGGLTNGAAGVLNIGSTPTITTLTASAVGNTVNYYASGAQTVKAIAYSNLKLSGSGAKAIANGTSVAANMDISGTAKANIGAGLTISVQSLSFGGVPQVAGTWGSTSSVATHTSNTYFSATTGMLNVATGPELPTLTSPTATSITDATATLGANITSNGGATLTARGTCWGTSAAPSGNCDVEGAINAGVFTMARTGLLPGTHLFYRGFAINAVGTGYSPDGSFYTEPDTQASAVDFTSVTAIDMIVNWTRGSGEGVIVLMKSGSAVDSNPADGTYTSYAADPALGSGTQIGAGNFVVYKGVGTNATVTGLSAGTTYYVAVYEYAGAADTSGVDQGTNYVLTPATGNQATMHTVSLPLVLR